LLSAIYQRRNSDLRLVWHLQDFYNFRQICGIRVFEFLGNLIDAFAEVVLQVWLVVGVFIHVQGIRFQ